MIDSGSMGSNTAQCAALIAPCAGWQVGLNALCEAQQFSAALRAGSDRTMVTPDRSRRTGNEAGAYGEHWRVGLHSTQPNLDRQVSAIRVRLLDLLNAAREFTK